MSEAPSDPNKRKADLLACPRWILESLKNERNARRELENQINNKSDNNSNNNNSDQNLLVKCREQEHLINQMKEQKDSQKEAIKRLLKTKEEEYQQSESMRLQIEENYKLLQEKTNRMKEQLMTIPQRTEQISILSSELEQLKVKYSELEKENTEKSNSSCNDLQSKLNSCQREITFKNEKLQELVSRCKNYQTEIHKKDKIIKKLENELQQLHNWVKEMQERKQKSDEGVRKLVEQKQMALAHKTEQIEVLKNELIKFKSKTFEKSLSSSIDEQTTNRRASMFVSKTNINPLGKTKSKGEIDTELQPDVTWNIYSPRHKTKVNTFEFCRKLAKAKLPSIPLSKMHKIPYEILPNIIGPCYIEKILVLKDIQVFKNIYDILEEDYAENASSALVNLFEHCDPLLCLEVIKYSTIQELEKTVDVNTLYRGNSLASKLLSKYSRIIGSDYLIETITPILNNIPKDTKYEMNPDRISEGESIEENEKSLLLLTQQLFDAIINSFDKIPVQFRILCKFLGDIVSKKFPDNPYFGIVNFIFLRFFCVAIAAPSIFDIKCDSISNSNVKRGVLLCSKILQCLANGAKLKETFMLSLNTWLDKTTPMLNEFFSKLTKEPSTTDLTDFTNPNFTNSKEESLVELDKIFKQEKENILKNIPETLSIDVEGYSSIDISKLLHGVNKYLNNHPPLKIIKVNPILEFYLQLLASQNSLMSSIVEKIDITLDYKEKEVYISAFLRIFSYVHSTNVPKIVNFWSDIECDNKGCIEGSSMISRMITKYVQIFCKPIGNILLGAQIKRVINLSIFLEIDEDRMTESQLRTRTEDATTILKLCTEWKNEILKALSKLPREIWEIFSFLAVDKQQIIGPIFIWTIICPCLENPELYGITLVPPPVKIKRTLSIISDVFMKMAKENLFYATSGSESNLTLCLHNLNSFIKQEAQSFCQEVQNWASCRPKNPVKLEPTILQWTNVIADVGLVHEYISNNYRDILTYIGYSTTNWKMDYNIYKLTQDILS